jgi:hypothetical protein
MSKEPVFAETGFFIVGSFINRPLKQSAFECVTQAKHQGLICDNEHLRPL